jgi:hypothetical protein
MIRRPCFWSPGRRGASGETDAKSKFHFTHSKEHHVMKKLSFKKKMIAGAAAGALVLGIAGGAFAYFTSTGSGTGSATTGSATPWGVVVTGDTTSLDLTPVPTIGSGPSDTESYKITNASTGQQNLAQAVISVSAVTPGPVAGPNACTASDFSVNGAAVGAPFTQTIGINEAAGGFYTNSVSLQLVDNGANQDRCQGASVTLKVAAT